jgi:outer membrane protein OmpU
MKKVLLATTALLMTAAGASAEVSLSGYGRFGLDYVENLSPTSTTEETQINMRMRVNIDGSVETDSGITFGGRVRLQWTDGSDGATLSPAMLYASGAGFRLEVGNANTAYDSAALMYNSEIGYLDRSLGDPNGDFFSFASTPGDWDGGAATNNRMGLFMSYSVDALNVRVSYVDPSQVSPNSDEELGLSADYNFGQFTVSGAIVDNAAGDGDADALFLGAEYALNDATNIGILYFDYNSGIDDLDSQRVTLYANYTMGALTYKGYVATDDAVAGSEDDLADGILYTNDVAFGLGVDYDLGGARLSGDIHRNYNEQTIVGLGVRFDF